MCEVDKKFTHAVFASIGCSLFTEKGQTVVTAKAVAPGAYRSTKSPAFSLASLANIMFHCQYCSVTCNR